MKKHNFLKLTLITLLNIFFIASLIHTTSAQTPKPASSEHIHSIPLVPIIVDGIEMEPEEISKYDGRPLYFLVNEEARSKNIVYIFTTLEKLTSFEEVTQGAQKPYGAMSSCTDPSVFYKDVNYGGSNPLPVSPGNDKNLLLQGNWEWYLNLESVKTTDCNVYTKLFGAPGQLWLACCGDTPNLLVYGWENKAEYLVVDPS